MNTGLNTMTGGRLRLKKIIEMKVFNVWGWIE